MLDIFGWYPVRISVRLPTDLTTVFYEFRQIYKANFLVKLHIDLLNIYLFTIRNLIFI